MRVDFGVLRNIIRDRNNKQKAATDSAECLREFLNLDTNLIEENRSMKQDEAANFIMSMQNWLLRRGFSSTKENVAIGDIFYADLGINYKPEFSYHHPVIIWKKSVECIWLFLFQQHQIIFLKHIILWIIQMEVR